MGLGATISRAVSAALADHGQVAVVRRRLDTFDEDAGGWIDGGFEDTAIHFVPEEFSEFQRATAGDALAGDVLIHVAASELEFVPYVGSADRKHLEVYFGDWEALADAELGEEAEEARSAGIVTRVRKDARYRTTQVLWTLTVQGTAHTGAEE